MYTEVQGSINVFTVSCPSMDCFFLQLAFRITVPNDVLFRSSVPGPYLFSGLFQIGYITLWMCSCVATSLWALMGPNGSRLGYIRIHWGPSRSIGIQQDTLIHWDPSGSTWIHQDPSVFIQDPLGSIGLHQDPSGSIRIHFDPAGSIETHREPLRSLRIHWGPSRSRGIQQDTLIHWDPARSRWILM